MNKTVKYTINGGVVCGLGFAAFNTWQQLRENNETKFDWSALLLSFAKGFGIGAAVGFTAGAICDYNNSIEAPIDTDTRLLSLIKAVQLCSHDEKYVRLKSKSEWLIQILNTEFKYKLTQLPYRFGSTEKQTALSDDFDIDICLPFSPNSFSSIVEMYYSVSDFLSHLVGTGGIIRIRDQKKSIGVFFYIGGEQLKIDILPYKITRTRGNKTSGYLYVNNKGIFEKATRTKTDLNLLNSIKLSEPQKKILIALKKWKLTNNIKISSHLLQYLILNAYQYNVGCVPKKFTEKLIMVITFIKDNIEHIQISSIENTNNIITDFSDEMKKDVYLACKQVLDDFEYQPNSIIGMLGS